MGSIFSTNPFTIKMNKLSMTVMLALCLTAVAAEGNLRMEEVKDISSSGSSSGAPDSSDADGATTSEAPATSANPATTEAPDTSEDGAATGAPDTSDDGATTTEAPDTSDDDKMTEEPSTTEKSAGSALSASIALSATAVAV